MRVQRRVHNLAIHYGSCADPLPQAAALQHKQPAG